MTRIALLVDDEQPLRAYVSMVLRREGFDVLEAADGIDALALLRGTSGAVDLLITDINMPRMTGIELVNTMRVEFPGIPVVYVSGSGLGGGLHNPPGRVVYLQKPFGPDAIRSAVRAVIPSNDAARHCG